MGGRERGELWVGGRKGGWNCEWGWWEREES